MEKKRVERMLVIPLGILIFMCLGTIYSWSVFRKPLEKLFNVGATQSGIPYTLFLASYALTMPFAGKFIKKIEPRLLIIVGGIIVGLAWVISGFAGNIELLSLTYGIFGGIGVGIVYGVPMAVVAKWFPKKKGLTVGLTLAGFGLSPFVTAPIASFLIDNYGVLSAFKIIGVVFIILITLLSLPLKFPDEKEHAEKKTNNIELDFSIKDIIKTKQFWGLVTTYTIGTLAGLMAIGISSPFGQEVIKMSSEKAAIYVSLFAIFNGIGRPIFGTLTDKFGGKKTAIISYIIIITASVIGLTLGAGKEFLYFIVFAMFWLVLGGWLAIAPTVTSNIFGAKHYAENYGVIFLSYGLGALTGGVISGVIRDKLGTYEYVFYPVIVLGIIGIIIAIKTLDKIKIEVK
ncbi:L-lactate MFS transporter [Haliovirga abyssi]|uniref:MFS transporter n=1 Tax=Haliovirga abyssi TaxID=2996794 RepID=A0AAU9D3K0_9FUSO|nr:OFA family MFS transporter [Haliovirga abyssi]BDU50554.1 MFS transporter [Haliovirga abyssi]